MNEKQYMLCVKMIETEEAIGTASALRRAQEMRRYLAHPSDGTYGRIEELASCTSKSRKSKVSNQAQDDTHIKFRTASGKIRYASAERKTNGGRISNLLNAGAPEFVIYSMCVHNSLVNYDVEKKVFPTRVFIEMLRTVNAIKSTNGTHPELAIQSSSKKLYTIVSEWPIVYDRDATYTEDDFEGLEW